MSSSELDMNADMAMSEEPKISTAMKNYISITTAQNMSNYEEFQIQEVIQGGESLHAQEDVGRTSNENILRFAQIFLRSVSKYELENPIEYGKRRPQSDEQTGMARMKQIASYKIWYCLWLRIKHAQITMSSSSSSKAGDAAAAAAAVARDSSFENLQKYTKQKQVIRPTGMLGRSYVTFLLEDPCFRNFLFTNASKTFLTNINQSSPKKLKQNVPLQILEVQFKHFVQGFEKSLVLLCGVSNVGVTDEDFSNNDVRTWLRLVWSRSFQEDLATLNKIREEKVKRRSSGNAQ